MRFALMTALVSLVAACGGTQEHSSNQHAGHNMNAMNATTHTAANNSNAPSDMSSHSHSASSPGASSAPFELQFLDTMIVHHKGAVDMAVLAETRASRADLKLLAADIISEQEREIAKMSEWRNSWFDGKADAVNMEFPGMSQGMTGMDIKKLESLKGAEFDAEFIRQMIPHHEGAITMAKALKNGKPRGELLELADDIITTQEAEIRQMREWQR